nr:immunoglobulin heavy chain junction region [Macaca mulatta]MOY18834.1 immunoglobulin heavy chain junction region [Macaca mulatta]MOY19342.1 immunoglobulin heavy chain junction region [Macaca mulatta]MOY19629.1 immunoglobulin heavy chain junction region [Macaca mulatta]MOY19912.1 immunoglobulin heavy chain junction region [Macaca mulatta]
CAREGYDSSYWYFDIW